MATQHILFDAIGTKWQIDFELGNNKLKKENLLQEILTLTEDFDLTYSRFRSDSLVTKVSRKPGKYVFPKNASKLFNLYSTLHQATDGKITPLVGEALSDAGYDANYSFIPQDKIGAVPDWDSAISINKRILTARKLVLLDFGAIGKGYLVDLLAEFLVSKKIENFCIDASGDIIHRHPKKAIKIGLENPTNPKEVIGVAEISNLSLCASAINRRKWQNFHHIIDPKTGEPPQNILATWVTATNTALADGLATGLFLVPAKQLKKYFQFEYVIINQDMSFEKSHDFPGELFRK